MKRLLVAVVSIVAASCQTSISHPERADRWDCGGEILQQTWKGIERSITAPEKARQLANTVLCSPRTKDANDYINTHLDESVETSSYGTGDLEERREILSKSRASDRFGGYGGSIAYTYSASLNEQGDIVLQVENEACVSLIFLRPRAGLDWAIREYQSACD